MFTDGLGYEGKVTLTLKSNNRVLESRTYKNQGTALLFKFLGYCLIGAFTEAENFLPNKIMLLYNNEADTSSGPSSGGTTYTDVQPRSAFVAQSRTPTIISDSTSSQVKVLYSFEVPRAAILAAQKEETNADKVYKFNQVALYSEGVSDDDIHEFSAYYYLVNGRNEWENVDPRDWPTSTVLLIEWELTLSNKNVETNTMGGN
jgi:hypothetical protein